MKKKIVFDKQATKSLLKGVETLANAVGTTLGPYGRTVILDQENSIPVATKDGVTVAKHIILKDPVEDIGAQLVKQASIKTANGAGDGTTTSTVLAYTLFKDWVSESEVRENSERESRLNPVFVKKGIEMAKNKAVQYIKSKSLEITTEDQLRQIATISGNNDPEIGEIVATALDHVGRDGIVTVEESRTSETYLESVEGMQFNRGYKSPYFVTDNKTMTGILNDPYILITEDRLTQAKDLLPLLEACSAQNKPLLIIADDIDHEALSTLVVNKMKGIISVIAVKAPEFGDRKKDALSDIATLTGGEVVSKEKGMKLARFNAEWLGRARKVVVGKEDTTIVDGKGSTEAIEEKVEDIKNLIDLATAPFEIEKLHERLGRLVGGVSVIHVGGYTEAEMKEKKDRVEDALHATRAAIEEGILPGGGTALAKISTLMDEERNDEMFGSFDEKLGYSILLNALKAPLRSILKNAYGEKYNKYFDVVENKDFWTGYDLREHSLVNTTEVGLIDPAKVTRLALENAVSVVGTLITTEAIVFDDPDSKEETNTNDLLLG